MESTLTGVNCEKFQVLGLLIECTRVVCERRYFLCVYMPGRQLLFWVLYRAGARIFFLHPMRKMIGPGRGFPTIKERVEI